MNHFSGILRPHGPTPIEWVDGADRMDGSTSDSPALAFHGELFGLGTMRGDLGLEESASLEQVLHTAWTRWSEGMLLRLDGVFALAVWTGNQLFLHRDRSGLRNLFTATGPAGELVFATDLNALLRLLGGPAQVARPSLHEYLRFGDISAPHTLFQGVVALDPGQVLTATPGQGYRTSKLAPDGAEVRSPPFLANAVEALESHLSRSIRERLRNARRPAAFLSGGIDSALVCALAAKERPDLTAVTVGFDSVPFDETPVAERVARHLGLAHEILRFSQSDYVTALDRLARVAEQPMADPAALPTLLALQKCSDQFDVVLDGTGADEAIGMMPARHVRLATEYASCVPTALRAKLTTLLRGLPWLRGYAAVTDFEHPADTMIRWRGFSRHEVEILCGEPVSFEDTRFYRTFHLFARQDHYERYTALLNAMPCERLTQTMLDVPVPVRYPFWDRQTEHFIRSLPAGFKYGTDSPKRILRELLAKHVPSAIWNSPKHSFDFPLAEFLSANDHALVRRHLSRHVWQGHSIVNADQVASLAGRFMAGDQQITFRIWSLIVLGAWMQNHAPSIRST